MQSSHWIALLKKLPDEVHNQLSVVTEGGSELLIQTVLQMEGEWLLIKGRMAACQDTGRLYYVPYDRIDYIGFNRLVKEEEFRAWYSATPAAGTPATPATDASSAGRTGSPNRAALLERVRSRKTTIGIVP